MPLVGSGTQCEYTESISFLVIKCEMEQLSLMSSSFTVEEKMKTPGPKYHTAKGFMKKKHAQVSQKGRNRPPDTGCELSPLLVIKREHFGR